MQSPVDKVGRNLLDNRLLRLSLFVASFLLASLMVFGPESLVVHQLILVFPAGLIAVLTQKFDELPGWSTLIAWLIFVAITLLAVLTKNRSLFVFLYVLFLLLLVVNLAGCNLILKNANFGL